MPDPSNIDDRHIFFQKAAKIRDEKRINVRPRVAGFDPVDERVNRRDVGDALLEAAEERLVVLISYRKITENYATRIWSVEPYSYRYEYLTGGGRWEPPRLKKVFYGFDTEAGTIKRFMFGNILNVVITNDSFTPQWEVEITWTPSSGPSLPGGPESPEWLRRR